MANIGAWIGSAAACLSMASFVPQVAKAWRERDTHGVSLRMYALTVSAFVMWVAYGLVRNEWPIVASNAVCLGLSLAVLVIVLRRRRTAKGRSAQPTP